ncbi:ATP-binding protein [Brevibacillus sp. AY1]|uniref:STAS domain-containing protein n=1 Tax=Brevibacillus sp. AY1 TaxID=2807621 RepID=UPI0024546D3A|nr:ATP-binding protein [Brevibacillus sp. AY1]MDH4619315.1 hypothetical protein [Brevibacillus sp. AY1]
MLKNAFEAIPGKGSIHIEHWSTEDEVIVCIQDSCVGIPPEKLGLLGTPFFTTKENGTGMGMTLAFKLEWIQAVRRVMWDYLYNCDRLNNQKNSKEHYYNLEKNINQLMDQFLNQFFISYSLFKDDLIRAQREIVEDLSVPIIPLTRTTSILPLIGNIDEVRANTIEDKVISQIGNDRIETLIIDLSGVMEMEADVVRKPSLDNCRLEITKDETTPKKRVVLTFYESIFFRITHSARSKLMLQLNQTAMV